MGKKSILINKTIDFEAIKGVITREVLIEQEMDERARMIAGSNGMVVTSENWTDNTGTAKEYHCVDAPAIPGIDENGDAAPQVDETFDTPHTVQEGESLQVDGVDGDLPVGTVIEDGSDVGETETKGTAEEKAPEPVANLTPKPVARPVVNGAKAPAKKR